MDELHVTLKQIAVSVGENCLYALDNHGRLWVGDWESYPLVKLNWRQILAPVEPDERIRSAGA